MQSSHSPFSSSSISALGIGAQLALSSLAAALTVVVLGTENGVILTVIGAVAMGLLVTATLQRSLWLAGEALDHLSHGLPTDGIPPRWHGPLGRMVARINALAERDRQVYDLRRGLLQQTHEAAAQAERNRLARDLHDSIKQQIFSIHMSAAGAQARAESDPEGAKAALADVKRSAHEAMLEMNALLQQLSPAPLEKVGLVQALRDQSEALGYRTGAAVTVEIGTLPGDDRLPPGAQESLFRIAQEALSNIARHARADQVALSLGQDGEDDPLILSIQDNGQGFEAGSADGGMGLTNIRQRVAALNGRLAIQSRPGAGTTLRVQIPLLTPIVAQENLMELKTDHTVNKLIVSGIAGGMALIAALYYPLYVVWPGQIIADWPLAGSRGIALVLDVLAGAVVVATGYLAARWVHQGGRGTSLICGAVAGGLAALIAFLVIGGTAAGLGGAQPMLGYGMRAAESDAHIGWLAGESMVNLFIWTYSAFWLGLTAGVGLGAIGGLLAPASSEAPHKTEMLTTLVAVDIAALISSSLALIVNAYISHLLFRAFVEMIPDIQPYAFTLSPAVAMSLSIGTPLVVEIACLVLGVVRSRTVSRLLLPREIAQREESAAWLRGVIAAILGLILIQIGNAALMPLNILLYVGAGVNLIFAALNIPVALAFRRQHISPERVRVPCRTWLGWIVSMLAVGIALILIIVLKDAPPLRVVAGIMAVATVLRVILDRRKMYAGFVWWALGIGAALIVVNIAVKGPVGPLLTLLAMTIQGVHEEHTLWARSNPMVPPARRTVRVGWHGVVNSLLGSLVGMITLALIPVPALLNLTMLIIGNLNWVVGTATEQTSTFALNVQEAYYAEATAVVGGLLGGLAAFGLVLIVWRVILLVTERFSQPRPVPAETEVA